MLMFFSFIATVLVFFGGVFFAWDMYGHALAFEALGAGWLGICMARAKVIIRECEEHKRSHNA